MAGFFYFCKMITIYHNNRCRKSREALQYLKEKGASIQIVEYLKNPLDAATWKVVFTQIDQKPQELVRTQEALWKSDFKVKEWSESELLDILAAHPKLVERPIVVSGEKGVLARPLENLIAFLETH